MERRAEHQEMKLTMLLFIRCALGFQRCHEFVENIIRFHMRLRLSSIDHQRRFRNHHAGKKTFPTSLYRINAVAAELREARTSATLARKNGILYRSSNRSSHNRAVLASSGTLCAFSDSRNNAESCGSNCVGNFYSTALSLVTKDRRTGTYGKCVTGEG